MAKGSNDLVELQVRILRKMFYRNGWGIFEAEMIDSPYKERTTIVGPFDKEFIPNEEYTMHGIKEYNQKYRSEQYKIVSVQNKLNNPDQIRSFLYMLTKNDNVVNQLVQKYGGDVIEAIAENRVDHNDISGLGEKTLTKLREKLMENLYLKDIVAELSKYDVTPNQMKKIARRFGQSAINVIKNNPYDLCKIHGIGFKKADEIARKMGVPEDSPYRIKFAIMHVLQENQQNGGNTWMDQDDMLAKVRDLTDISSTKINSVLNDPKWFEEDELTIVDGYKVALTPTYLSERYIADKILELNRKSKPLNLDVDSYVVKIRESHPTLTEEQIQLFYNFTNHNVNVLRGYAGCGKSWVTKLLVDMIRKMSVLLLAPTGKASKVIEGYVNMPASTIHRAIGLYGSEDDEDGDAEKESFHDVVIMDEASMCDVFIKAKLLKALKNPDVRLLIIGDDFQLSSVGCGNVLHDLIESNEVTVRRWHP
jgi:exodeoxyribonuclease V alpha subunit